MPYTTLSRLAAREDRFREILERCETLTELLAKVEMVYLRASIRALPAVRRQDIVAAAQYSTEEARAKRSLWSKTNLRKALIACATRSPEEDRRVRSAAGKKAWQSRTELDKKRHLKLLANCNTRRQKASEGVALGVVRTYAEGVLTVTEIASRYDIHEMSVYRILRKSGVPRRIPGNTKEGKHDRLEEGSQARISQRPQ